MKYFASPGYLNPIVKVWPNIQPVSPGNNICSERKKKRSKAKKEAGHLVSPGLIQNKSAD